MLCVSVVNPEFCGVRCRKRQNCSSRITRDKGALAKDDRLDPGAPGMAVAYWAKAMSVETEKVVQANWDKAMQEELERCMRHAIGRKPTGSLYATTMHRR